MLLYFCKTVFFYEIYIMLVCYFIISLLLLLFLCKGLRSSKANLFDDAFLLCILLQMGPYILLPNQDLAWVLVCIKTCVSHTTSHTCSIRNCRKRGEALTIWPGQHIRHGSGLAILLIISYYKEYILGLNFLNCNYIFIIFYACLHMSLLDVS